MAFLEAASRVPLDDPGLLEAGDHWVGLCSVNPSIVIAGSAQGSFCAYSLLEKCRLQTWTAPKGMRLLELHYLRDAHRGSLWTLESDGTHIHVARYVGPWSWASRDSAESGGSGGRSSFRLETRQATIRLALDPPRLVLSRDDGHIDIYDACDDKVLPPRRLEHVKVSTVLGISTTGLFFAHLALWGSLLVVALPTDVWLIQLGVALPITTHGGGKSTPPSIQAHAAMRGTIQDDVNMLDLAMPKPSTCVRVTGSSALPPYDASWSATPVAGGQDTRERRGHELVRGVVAAHLRFSARWAVVSVELLPPAAQQEAAAAGSTGQTGAHPHLMVVAGKAAHIYEVQPHGGGGGRLACVSLRSHIGFNSQVLHTARSDSCEHPWFFVLTLSGLEVWALPSLRASPVSTHPCRLLVQRLEFFHQLDRLPPLGMSVVHDRLLIVPNPRGYTPHSLSFIQFHTTPRPSPHDAMPELRPLVGGAQGTGDEAGNASPGTVLILQLAPLATVFRAIRQEVMKEIMPDHGEGEEEESLRFLFAVEYLDSSVVPPPEAVAYESGVELLKSMYALLRRVSSSQATALGQGVSGIEKDALEHPLHELHVVETRRLYAALSAECATLLGELLLEPKAEGVTRQMLAACDWFGRSDTPVQTVVERLMQLQTPLTTTPSSRPTTPRGMSDKVTSALVGYLDRVLGLLPERSEEEGPVARPPLLRAGAKVKEQAGLWRVIVEAYVGTGTPRLLPLLMQSRLPWTRARRARELARHAIETTSGDDGWKILALLVLDVYEIAAVMEEEEVTVQLEKGRNAAWVDLPSGREKLLDTFGELAAKVDDSHVACACLRATETVVKRIQMQGLSLAVKGPLFNQLESQRPAVLAQVLAQATFRGPRPLDATQILRLLGPYGTALSNEISQAMTGEQPSDRTASRRGEGAQEDWALTQSRASVRAFLEAKFEPILKQPQGGEQNELASLLKLADVCKDPLSLRSLLLAELIGLFLDDLTGARGATPPEETVPGESVGWVCSLGKAAGYEHTSASRKLEKVLIALSATRDAAPKLVEWDALIRRLDDRGTGSNDESLGRTIPAFWPRATKVTCLAASGQMREAWDMLLVLTQDVVELTGDNTLGVAAVLDFGVTYCGTEGSRWSSLVSTLHDLSRTNIVFSGMYKAMLAKLAGILDMYELLQAFPNDTGLSVFLEAVSSPDSASLGRS